MKKFLAVLLAGILMLSVFSACGKTQGGNESESEQAESTADPNLDSDSPEALGAEFIEKAIVQTCMAYFYQNPNGQYDLCKDMTADHWGFGTEGVSPEWAGPDAYYYAVCRSFINDVLIDVFGEDFFKGGIHGSFFKYMSNAEAIEKLNIVNMYYTVDGKPIEGSVGKQYLDKNEFIDAFKKEGRPGDIVYIVKPGDSGHVVFYLGDVYETGQTYVMHCWPVDGGSINLETAVNKYEPKGGICLQSANDLLYLGGYPKYTFDSCEKIYILRLTQDMEGLKDLRVTENARARVENPFMSIRKNFSEYMYNTLVPGDEITVTETIKSEYGENFMNLVLKEYVPEGTTLVEGSVKTTGKGTFEVNGDEISWTESVFAMKDVTLSYTVKVNDDVQPGQTITFRNGSVGNSENRITTRANTYKCGTTRLSEEEIAKLAAATAAPSGTTELNSVNAFYQNTLGFNPGLPATTQELLDSLYEAKKDLTVGEFMLNAKENPDEAGTRFKNMLIRRGEGGWYMKLENNLEDRLLDYRAEYFTPGDVFVTLTGNNYVEAKLKDEVHYYIYLGDERVLVYYYDGTAEIADFESTVARIALDRVILILRPAQVR